MGLRYRKSINLGGGFRINLSKSGVGYSWGVKGARITKTARGTTRSTISIPGTGISYVEETGKRKNYNIRSRSGDENQNIHPTATAEGTSTEIIDIDSYQPAEYEDLLRSIQKVQNLNTLSTILICTFLLSAMPVFIFTGIAGVILKVYIRQKLAITMEYAFDEEAHTAYEKLNATWMSMNENQKFWQTISESQINQKTSGGASRGVTRIPAKAINKTPYYIRPNIAPFGLKLRKQKLFFLPDKLLVVSGRKVGAVNYSDITMGFGISNFVETDPVPNDAKVIHYTWLKVNKNGTPDKRFKGNRQVPICEYGTIVIESGNALHVEIMCSNSSTVDKMKMYANQVFQKSTQRNSCV